jgi:hypothetical protein
MVHSSAWQTALLNGHPRVFFTCPVSFGHAPFPSGRKERRRPSSFLLELLVIAYYLELCALLSRELLAPDESQTRAFRPKTHSHSIFHSARREARRISHNSSQWTPSLSTSSFSEKVLSTRFRIFWLKEIIFLAAHTTEKLSYILLLSRRENLQAKESFFRRLSN